MGKSAALGGMRRGDVWVTAVWMSVAALILIAPLAAMRFTDEVDWSPGDFLFAGILLFGSGAAYEAVSRMGGLAYRAATGLAILTGFLMVWIEGAVGIIGDGENPSILLFAAVLGGGVIGAVVSRFRARGMQWTLFAMAAGATLTAAIALSAGWAELREAVLTEGFAAMWLLSGGLYRAAAQRAAPPASS